MMRWERHVVTSERRPTCRDVTQRTSRERWTREECYYSFIFTLLPLVSRAGRVVCFLGSSRVWRTCKPGTKRTGWKTPRAAPLLRIWTSVPGISRKGGWRSLYWRHKWCADWGLRCRSKAPCVMTSNATVTHALPLSPPPEHTQPRGWGWGCTSFSLSRGHCKVWWHHTPVLPRGWGCTYL